MKTKYLHQYLMARSNRYADAVDFAVDRFDKSRVDERGITSTEVAVLVFIAVSVAGGLGAIIWEAVRTRAEQTGDVEMPVIGGETP